MTTKLEQHGITPSIIQPLADTMTLQDAIKIINQKYIVPKGEAPASYMALVRFCEKFNIQFIDKRFSNAVTGGKLVDTLSEAKNADQKLNNSINLMDKHISEYNKQLIGITIAPGMDKQEIIKLIREHVNIKKEIRETVSIQEKLLKSKVTNLDRLTEYQDTLLKKENYKKLVLAMIDFMNQTDEEAKAKFLSSVKSDYELWDTLKLLLG